MKVIINRKIYDTETAREVAKDQLHNRNSISWFDESLYLAPNGAWFLAGEGGPLSHYGVDLGQGEKEGRQMLTLMSIDEVMDWLEQRGEYHILETHFSDRLENA
ncbi:hypothetical protein [Roseovarius arcticus]|uniref:hypothetical protein n=1 Tax=Roseovarius arcticus TaxID=2547404 RepID=UPI001110285C|nr:hypothetical protein [Roseovarius arcticus]